MKLHNLLTQKQSRASPAVFSRKSLSVGRLAKK